MKPWCDRPLCTRQTSHQHAPEASDTPPERSVSDETPVPVPVLHQNGREPENRSAEQAGKDLLVRAQRVRAQRKARTSTPPEPRKAAGGAASEVEADVELEDSAWLPRWEAVAAEIEAAETRLSTARARRRELLGEMNADLSLGDIAEVTGITRQRVGQILKP